METSNCHFWKGAKTKKGYGAIQMSGKIFPAHRLSYRLHKGPIPRGMLVCHRCDNPACINPDHLFLGTAKENTDDMSNKFRGLYGRKPIAIKDIITGETKVFNTQRELGKHLGRTQSAISYAIRRQSIIDNRYSIHNANP